MPSRTCVSSRAAEAGWVPCAIVSGRPLSISWNQGEVVLLLIRRCLQIVLTPLYGSVNPAHESVMHTIRLRLMQSPLRRAATPERLLIARQFLRFGVVGLLGLVVDTAVVYTFRGTFGLYGAGVIAYFGAATGTWSLNRVWTFRGRGSGSAHRQWAMFLIANLAGFVLNRGTYALLVTFLPAAAAQPVIATSAGAVAGMFVNFNLSRRVVFR